MGFAGMISREIIDRGIGMANAYGWSPISPSIRYTKTEEKIAKEIGITGIEEISNIENIVFYNKSNDINTQRGKVELIYKWRYITEHRLNALLALKRKLRCQGSQLSLQASYSEIERAHENVLSILSQETEVVFSGMGKDDSDDDFEQVFAEELLGRLLGYLKTVNDSEEAKLIVNDLQYLAAVIMKEKDSDGEFRCSSRMYIQFLKELNLQNIEQECDDCRVETVFTDYKFCMVCGRRL